MKNRQVSEITVGLLLVVTAITACAGAEATPIPIAQTEGQGPTVEIGSAALGPDRTMSVCAGQTVALTTKATGQNLSYAWSVDGGGRLQRQEGKGDEGSSNRYTAPITWGEEEVVKVTATDDLNRSGTDQVVIQVRECPTGTPVLDTPLPMKALPSPGDAPIIGSPKEGEKVGMNITVSGSVTRASMEGGTNLYVIVQPHGYSYWVQEPPAINDDGTWKASPVFVGQPSDEGLSFDICAVLTDAELSRGTELPELPQSPRHCITVERGPVLPPVRGTPQSGAPVITSPKEGDRVEMNITVSGSAAKAALNSGTNLYVIVQPHGYSYWVQALPTVNNDGSWEATPVFAGQPNDTGLSFDICAVLTDAKLRRGQELLALPSGPASCITVERR